MATTHHATLCRPYDAAIPSVFLEAARRRRESPDGDPWPVKYRITPHGDKIAIYPWDKMKAGDFFLVPLEGRSATVMRTRFKHVALRRDFEVTVVKWNLGTARHYIPGLRVTLSFTGKISELRRILGLPTPKFLQKAEREPGSSPSRTRRTRAEARALGYQR